MRLTVMQKLKRQPMTEEEVLCFLKKVTVQEVLRILMINVAGMEINITDAGKNRLQISGEAESESYVTAVIFGSDAENEKDNGAIVIFQAPEAKAENLL